MLGVTGNTVRLAMKLRHLGGSILSIETIKLEMTDVEVIREDEEVVAYLHHTLQHGVETWHLGLEGKGEVGKFKSCSDRPIDGLLVGILKLSKGLGSKTLRYKDTYNGVDMRLKNGSIKTIELNRGVTLEDIQYRYNSEAN